MTLLTASGVHSNFGTGSDLLQFLFEVSVQHWKKENMNIHDQTIYLVTYSLALLIATFLAETPIVIDASKVWALPLPLVTGAHL